MYKLLIVEDDPALPRESRLRPKRGDLRFALSKIFATFLPNSANTGRTSFFLI